MTATEQDLTVAITGPTGTFGTGLVPLLQEDDRVSAIVGVARRPFDPGARGWTKMDYRQGDVRDQEGLVTAFQGCDVVVHLAFLIVGRASRGTSRGINIDGTLDAFRAAAAVGARRFVYASSLAAYGFHADNPVGITEEWPTRPADSLAYAREKAELEEALHREAALHPQTALYLVRPCAVVGPHFLGAKHAAVLRPLAMLSDPTGRVRRLPVPVPALVPRLDLQLVHEDDVGQALHRCVIAAGPPGAYNLAGDGVLNLVDVAREFGLLPIPLPAAPFQLAARAAAKLPLPAAVSWIEAAAHPAIMDTSKAHRRLGWKPRYTGLEALRDTLAPRL
jgi:nucleoside-diphosphate-sugar epimerase